MLGTRTGEGTRSHAPFHRGQLRAGLQRRARPRRQAPAHATSAACPGPAPEAADRRRGKTPRAPAPASGPSRSSMSSATSPAVEPAPGTNPAGSNPPPDGRHWRPGRPHPVAGPPRSRVLPQPAIHRGITAVEDRPVMSARIDPLDPDSIHNPAVFQPARAPGSNPPSGPPNPHDPRRSVRRPAQPGLPMVLHFAHKTYSIQ